MPIKVTLLGTGTSQGVPVVACDCPVCKSSNPKDKRLRTSVLIETPLNTFVIDAGPDFRQQMLREKVSRLDAILITHDHKDHMGGIDDVRAFNWIMQKPMTIFATEASAHTIRKDFSYAFADRKYPGVPEIDLIRIGNEPFSFRDDLIVPVSAFHGELPVLGFRIGDFSYLTDASYVAPDEKEKMRGSKVIILNALRQKKHHSHFTLQEAVAMLQDLNPQKGYLTHISHQMGLHDQICQTLPAGIALGWDGLCFRV